MSKCIKCKSTENYNFAIDNGMCNSCIEGTIENLQDDNAAKEAELAKHQEFLKDVIKGYKKSMMPDLGFSLLNLANVAGITLPESEQSNE